MKEMMSKLALDLINLQMKLECRETMRPAARPPAPHLPSPFLPRPVASAPFKPLGEPGGSTGMLRVLGDALAAASL